MQEKPYTKDVLVPLKGLNGCHIFLCFLFFFFMGTTFKAMEVFAFFAESYSDLNRRVA